MFPSKGMNGVGTWTTFSLKMVTYCRCKKSDYMFRGLHEPPTFLGNELWVCATCCLPTRLVWEGLVRPCRGCLADTPLPWNELCQKCFRTEFPNQKYNGLLWASRRAMRNYIWPLPKLKTEIRPALPDKPLQDKGTVPFGAGNTVPSFRKLSDSI